MRAREGENGDMILSKQRLVRSRGNSNFKDVKLVSGVEGFAQGHTTHLYWCSVLGLEFGLLDSQFSALSNVYCES